ncbi:branched-chain amino acid ABC transporter permease [Pusillimonas sp. TS35]|uniref:branched-chain amino acid ABC transporter permease n=1 Tax=Paracandidimonas lactea TaxID=2895524 RepID=UPI00136A0584|nr:branched-chain amino acid ABC transporter permease [Paracandidimonas lactea]MYN12604.1 branched-chain amino acid ABC transporter permease [Pusillimonas sp. TS35]
MIDRFCQLPLATRAGLFLLLLLALAPVFAQDEPFAITLLTRILIFALAALSLNLILGYGGMVSFGHALFLGLGVYSAAILSHHGIASGWAHLLVTLAVCGAVGLITGCIVLRTTGISFIMITLAFAQMFYFLFVSLSQYGGDDGMRLAASSRFGGLQLGDGPVLYLLTLALVCAALYGCHRLIHSRLGMVLRASNSNDKRMRALGYPTFRYRLAVYVLAAMICGVAGLLYANLTQFASPSYMSWTTSGELIVMVMLGGLGTLFGPVFGAVAMILAEEGLKAVTDHWMVIFGPLIVIVALASRQGLVGLLAGWEHRRRARAPLDGRRRA